MNIKKAQSSSEYIVMLSVALLISFVAAGFIFSGSASSSSARYAKSEQYWGGVAEPFRLNAWALHYKNVSGYAESNLTIVFMNPTKRVLTIKNITIRPGTFEYAFASDGTSLGNASTLSQILFPGDTLNITIRNQQTGSGAWVPSQSYLLNMNITYDGDIAGMMQIGREPLVGQTAFQ